MRHQPYTIESNRVSDVLKKMAGLTVTVFGDFCLDAYWVLENGESEHSVETGLALRRVKEQRYTPGGAGNVAANLLDLGVGTVEAIGLAGDDPFGSRLISLLKERGIGCDGFLVRPEWQTMVYAKPLQAGDELNRMDFGAFNTMRPPTRDHLLKSLRLAAGQSDAIVLNQQVPTGVTDPTVLDGLNEIIRDFPETLFVVDARHNPAAYREAVLKLNSEEAARYLEEAPAHVLSRDAAADYARRISERTQHPVFLTRGEHGMVVAQGSSVHFVPGIRIAGPIDPVGAGDSVVAALAAVLGCGEEPTTAAALANVVATITVQKLKVTGTATPREVLDALSRVVYRQEE